MVGSTSLGDRQGSGRRAFGACLEGFDEDEQADRTVHGGPEKAVHHNAAEHYDRWRAELPELATRLAPGGFGENVSTIGLTEETLHIGDVLSLGSAVVQVSQGRQPCWKLNVHVGHSQMAWRFQNKARTGWYYCVLAPGRVRRGDRIVLRERLNPG